ncbi:hypothetical protein ACROYT_G005181 [Oculina patagonica]
MDNKTLSRVSGKQTLLTRRLDLSCGLIKKENEQNNAEQVSTENSTRPVWNEARSRPRRTSAPAELPPIKDALPKLTIKTRARTLSLRGENNEIATKEWIPSKVQVNASALQNKTYENPSTDRPSVKAIQISVADFEQRPLSDFTNNNSSVGTHCLGLNDKNSLLNHPGQVIARKCLTQEALICHDLGYTEADEDSASKKKDMIVRWLNSDELSSNTQQGLERSRAFPQQVLRKQELAANVTPVLESKLTYYLMGNLTS